MIAPTPSPHPELDAMAIDLFRLVSRMEYALKATGYHERDVGIATPNWNAFARDIEAPMALIDDDEFARATDYLLTHPPKRQMIRDRQLIWEESPVDNQPRARLLLSHVRQVRNNLFHGGKFNGRWFDPQRSAELISASLVILRRAVDLHPAVQEAFMLP